MHPALRKGPLFYNPPPTPLFFTKPPFHFLPTGLDVLTDALLRTFGTHYRKLSLTVTLLLCLSLG